MYTRTGTRFGLFATMDACVGGIEGTSLVVNKRERQALATRSRIHNKTGSTSYITEYIIYKKYLYLALILGLLAIYKHTADNLKFSNAHQRRFSGVDWATTEVVFEEERRRWLHSLSE